jgi:hypothetical protein
MATDSARLVDNFVASLAASRAHEDEVGIRGFGWAELFDHRGQLKQFVPFRNLITDVGDQYYAQRSYPIMAAPSATITAVTNVASPVFTATAHGCSVGDKVTISGATPAGYNGSWVVTAVTANSFTVYVGTALGAGSAFNWSFARPNVPVASGMKLGTGATAVAKSGAGAALVTYGTGVTANKAFDATYPQLSNLGAGLGDYTVYKTTWNAGEATVTGLNEVVIVNENVFADATTAAANTISRALLSPVVNKGASDTLAITWNHKFLGV